MSSSLNKKIRSSALVVGYMTVVALLGLGYAYGDEYGVKYVFSYEKRYAEFKSKFGQILPQAELNEKIAICDDNCWTNIVINSTSGFGYGIVVENVHGDITKAALRDQLSDECLDFLIEANVAQDHGEAFTKSTNHFDNNSVCESYAKATERLAIIPSAPSKSEQLKLFGAVIHAVQDFYSHSNYLELTLSGNDKLKPENIDLFDFESYCPKRGSYKTLGDVFTGYYEGNHGPKEILISDEDYANPKSHLHWNKDFSPSHDRLLAERYGRSSLKKSDHGHGILYFDFVFDLQVRHTKILFSKAFSGIKGFDRNCRILQK